MLEELSGTQDCSGLETNRKAGSVVSARHVCFSAVIFEDEF